MKIKAGNRKTSGYVNATGFVWTYVTATARLGSTICNLEATDTMMIGKIREVNGFPEIESVSVDNAELQPECGTNDFNVKSLQLNVVTKASDPEWDPLTYRYRVTAGKIIGTADKVVWDLTAVAPGTYTVFVGVDDGKGILKTKSNKVVVRECSKVLN